VIDVEELRHRHESVKTLVVVMGAVAGKEKTGVVIALDERVDGITVGFHASNNDCAVVVSERLGLPDSSGTSGNSLIVDACRIIDTESDILHAIAVLGVVRGELLMVRVQR